LWLNAAMAGYPSSGALRDQPALLFERGDHGVEVGSGVRVGIRVLVGVAVCVAVPVVVGLSVVEGVGVNEGVTVGIAVGASPSRTN
jgi:hypothetical protein